MLNLGFFRNPRFSAASAAVTLTFFALFGSLFLVTQYMQSVMGYSALPIRCAITSRWRRRCRSSRRSSNTCVLTKR